MALVDKILSALALLLLCAFAVKANPIKRDVGHQQTLEALNRDGSSESKAIIELTKVTSCDRKIFTQYDLILTNGAAIGSISKDDIDKLLKHKRSELFVKCRSGFLQELKQFGDKMSESDKKAALTIASRISAITDGGRTYKPPDLVKAIAAYLKEDVKAHLLSIKARCLMALDKHVLNPCNRIDDSIPFNVIEIYRTLMKDPQFKLDESEQQYETMYATCEHVTLWQKELLPSLVKQF